VAGAGPRNLAERDRTGEAEGKQGGWGGSFGSPLAAGGMVDGAWVSLRVGRRRVAGLFKRRDGGAKKKRCSGRGCEK